jgi:cation:H+ antiporter
LIMSLDNTVGRLDGVILFVGIIVYTVWLIRSSRRETSSVREEYAESVDELEKATAERPLIVQIGLVVIGLTALVVGSQFLVSAATDIAADLGVSDLVIGLTVVAVGTSLPELATSVLAAIRGQRDIAVGNVVGSNIFNLLCVLGLSGAVSSNGVPVGDAALRIDFPVMLAATFVLLPIVWKGFIIQRWEGAVLAVFYVVYVVYLILDSTDHDAAEVVGPAVLIVAPLVILTFVVMGVQGARRHRAAL